MSATIYDQDGAALAVADANPPRISPIGADELGLKWWAIKGVPGRRGAEVGDLTVEMESTIPPDDQLWGLALLEECERRGWEVREDEGVAMASEPFDESKHPRVGKGQHGGGQFGEKEEMRTPESILSLADMTKIGGSLGGTTPGAQYKDKFGAVWYVKEVKTNNHALNEVLAARLYALAGVKTPDLRLVKSGDKLWVGSRVEKLLGTASIATPEAARGFAADAWLANWDTVGKTGDNLQIGENGAAVRVDVGGSLVFRAQGGSKASLFTSEANEINSLRDPDGPNPQSSKVFSGLSHDAVRDSILATVGHVSDASIDAVVKASTHGATSIGGLSTNELSALLKQRRDFLLKLATKKSKVFQEGAPDVKGKVYGMAKQVFPSIEGHDELFAVEQEKKPKLPSGPQMRTMREASKKAKMGFTTDNWEDPAHPRPDRDGVPTNRESLEFKRLFVIGHGMCSDWKGTAQGSGASALKRAALRVFNANGIVWNNAETDDEPARWDNDRVVRMMYRDTQERLAATGVTEHDRVVLFRGIKEEVVVAGVLEGHSLSQAKAEKSFDGYDVVKRWVSPVEVLADNKSAFFQGTGFKDESEWIVFAGGFGTPATTTISTKKKAVAGLPVVPSTGIIDYTGGKPATVPEWKTKPVAHVVAKAAGEAQEKKWAAVTDEKIIKIKQMHAAGETTVHIHSQTGIAPGTIHGILKGQNKKYATTGPRTKGMKEKLNLSENQWQGIKKMAHEQVNKYGKADFEAIGKFYGVHPLKAATVFFQQKKQ